MKKTISFAVITVSLVALSCLLVMGSYLAFEPEMIIAQVTSTSSITVTLNVTEEITLTPPSNIVMDPAISVSADSSIGSGAWKVVTNAADGYGLTFHATGTPALQSDANSFVDATTTSPVTWGFGVGESCASTTCFGFSVYGDHASTTVWGNESAGGCGPGGGAHNASLNYRGFEGTTLINVASSDDKTGTGGTNTTLCVTAAQNNEFAPSGVYRATIVGTATTQ